MKKIILIAYALTCTASLYAGHSKELKLTSPEGVHEVMFQMFHKYLPINILFLS